MAEIDALDNNFFMAVSMKLTYCLDGDASGWVEGMKEQCGHYLGSAIINFHHWFNGSTLHNLGFT